MMAKSESGDGYDYVITQFLLFDVEPALTFTDIAADVTDHETVKRTVRNARRAYDLITLRRSSLPIAAEDAGKLDDKLKALKDRLLDLGERFD